MRRTFIGLGSNMGDREENLRNALELLSQADGLVVRKVSSLYETEPLGVKCQPPFLNAVAEVETTLPPLELLDVLEGIEKALGRTRKGDCLERPIDLDLLWFEGVTMQTKRLTLPHPRLWERAFVLVPLSEIDPDLEIAGQGKIAVRAEEMKQQQSIRLFKRLCNVLCKV